MSFSGNNCPSVSPINISIKAIGAYTPEIQYNRLQFCQNEVSVSVPVDPDYSIHTDLTGFEWTIPSGWSIIGPSNSYTIRLSIPDGCQTGWVSVRVKSTPFCTPIHYSRTATRQLLRDTPSTTTILPPFPNYEARCGNQTPVTFSLSSAPICGSVIWNLPTGWQTTSGQSGTVIVGGGNPSINLVPSGTNGGTISAAISACGFTFNAPNYNIPYNPNSDLPQGGSISGDNISCSRQFNKTFSAPLYQGADYQWIYNGQVVGTNSHLLTFTPYIPGFSTLEVRISKGAGCLPVVIKKNLWRGTPPSVTQFAWYDAMAYNSGEASNDTPSQISISPNRYTYIDLIAIAPYVVAGTVDSYEWEKNGIALVGNEATNTVSFSSEESSVGFVRVRSVNPCGKSNWFVWNYELIPCYSYPVSCTNNNGGQPSIGRSTVYPNPASNEIEVNNLHSDEQIEITLHNSFGQMMLQKIIPPRAKAKINIQNFPEGLYYLHQKKGKKLTKQTIQIKR